MAYVVYVNTQTSYTKVHRSSCIEYIKRVADSTDNGYWKIGFPDINSANQFAKQTGLKTTPPCKICKP